MEAFPHKNIIVAVYFNNTPFSYNYKKLKGDMKDAFLEKGSGIGTTFYFDGFPLRIDYILVSPNVKVKQFHTVKETFSDHRSEEHTSELQSRGHLVCRLLLEKKKQKIR